VPFDQHVDSVSTCTFETCWRCQPGVEFEKYILDCGFEADGQTSMQAMCAMQKKSMQPPFTVTGLDYAGPLFCLDFPKKKLYILLLTCAVVRAVHLEVTDSLSLPACLLALRRFSARRDLPSVIYSDNAKTFVGADQLLQRYFGVHAPK
jgi:hypothetical protein